MSEATATGSSLLNSYKKRLKPFGKFLHLSSLLSSTLVITGRPTSLVDFVIQNVSGRH